MARATVKMSGLAAFPIPIVALQTVKPLQKYVYNSSPYHCEVSLLITLPRFDVWGSGGRVGLGES